MWSSDFNGQHGSFTPQQRVLFPVRANTDATRINLVRALEHGNCTGLLVMNPDDTGVLLLVRQALQTILAKNPHLRRSDFSVAIATSVIWAPETYLDRIQAVVTHLHLQHVDVVLLTRPPSLDTELSTSERKRLVLHQWESISMAKMRGLANALGLSDFTIPEIEFIFASVRTSQPRVLLLELRLSLEQATKPQLASEATLNRILQFAHGRQMDVVARFTYNTLVELPTESPLRDKWNNVVESITQRHHQRLFDIQTVHEAQSGPSSVQKQAMASSSALQTGTQIIVRFLIQKGVVVVPIPVNSGDEEFSEEDAYEIFSRMMHPFSALPPSSSPEIHYFSILCKEDMQLIDQRLPLTVHIPKTKS